METEIINSAVGLSTGQMTGGGVLGVVSLGLIAYIRYSFTAKPKKDTVNPVETSAELELKLRKFLSGTVIDAITKISDNNIMSNEEIADNFVKYLKENAESQKTINESFKNVYKKIEDESKQLNSRIDHVQENWVHKDRLKSELAIKKDIGT